MRCAFFILSILLVAASGHAGVTLDFWHRYTPPAGTNHYGFHLTDYKRELFFGSCGISTRSLQWGYTFDLTGNGPTYTHDQLTATDENLKPLNIVGGTIVINEKKMTADIHLEIDQSGTTNHFIGNGVYRIKPLK